MTAVIGIKVPSANLNPKRRQVAFQEDGIILVADTRFTSNSQPLPGDGLKVGPLARNAIAGYSGDVTIAERALKLAVQRASRSSLAPDPVQLQRFLQQAWKFTSTTRPPFGTTVLLGTYYRAPRLYRLDSLDGFTPRLRDGPETIGHGGARFHELLDENLDWLTQSWQARARQPQFEIGANGMPIKIAESGNDPFPLGLVELSMAASMSLDELIQEESDPTVGGKLNGITLRSTGWSSNFVSMSRDNGETWETRSFGARNQPLTSPPPTP